MIPSSCCMSVRMAAAFSSLQSSTLSSTLPSSFCDSRRCWINTQSTFDIEHLALDSVIQDNKATDICTGGMLQCVTVISLADGDGGEMCGTYL
jgi:hypothetical protein